MGLEARQARIDDPRQIRDLLRAPSIAASEQHVIRHLDSILPKLSAESPSRNLSSIPSSHALRAHLDQLKADQVKAEQRTIDAETELRKQLVASLTSVKALKDRLERLPDGIATTEDELLELCENLVGTAASGPESSRNAPKTLLKRLEQLHDAVEQLKHAKAYFTILAKAEDLRLAIEEHVDLKDGRNLEGDALHLLGELNQLVQQSEKLAGAQQSQLKAIGFLYAQRDAAFQSIRKNRSTRLQEALAANDWPPQPPSRQAQKDDDDFTSDGTATIDTSFARSAKVRKAWSDLCEFQNRAEHLGLMPRATAKPPVQRSIRAPGDRKVKAGSDEYVPLLATQVLVEPLLLRFRYHFDGTRPTNRLDKPEWYLSHVESLIRSQATLFLPPIRGVPGSGGPVARLCRFYANAGRADRERKAFRYIDTYAELLHSLLTPLRRKLASSMPSLLEHPSLLAHTVFQALTFDADLREHFPASRSVLNRAGTTKLADDILANQEWFNKWLDGEKEFALRRFEEIMDAPDAWAIGSSDSMAEDDELIYSSLAPGSVSVSGDGAVSEASSKTTKSARAAVEILESVTDRYRPLPSLAQRLSFLAVVQLPILRAYHQRLCKSLDAFESLSSAFARAMPGEISAGIGAAAGVSTGSSDSDMVRGLRGLGRLVKAMLSAAFICEELERWTETAFFVEMSDDLQETEEGQKLALGLKKDDEEAQDRELDAASLSMLLRRGLKRGAGNVRPIGAGSDAAIEGDGRAQETEQVQLLTDSGRYGVWEEPRRKFGEVVARATNGIERLVVSEVLEQLRNYAHRSWNIDSPVKTSAGAGSEPVLQHEHNDLDDAGDGEGEEEESVPTASLIASLSMLSTHLSHLVAILEPTRSVPIYRRIATAISAAVVERVVMAGGSHRFSLAGAQRFQADVQQGWLGVVSDIARSSRHASSFGRKPEAPWRSLRDVATLLTLPSGDAADGGWTLAKATRVAFDGVPAELDKMCEDLAVDPERANVKEVLRRRVECWR